jgi:MoaA/NifB/PqqE/SkfB family radical SAM enzyme
MPSIAWKKDPIQLTFFLTRRCNSKCPFCFYLKSAGAPARHNEELSIDEIGKISRSLGNRLWLAFSGGEIYLRDDLAEISGIFYRNNRPAIMLFPTNGMLPGVIRERTERILQECKKSVIAVKLSVDGVGGAHDALRDTPGSFEKTIETYRLLEPLLAAYPNFELGVNTVFCSENQDDMDKIIDFVGGLPGVGTHTISLVRGSLSDERYKDVDPEKYLRATQRLAAHGCSKTYRFRGAGIKAAQDVVQRRLIHRTLLEQKRLIPCYAGTLNLVLSETGEVHPCEILQESFGNVRDFNYDIRKVAGSAKADVIRKSISEGRCYCTHECYFMTNILFNPRLYPQLAREFRSRRSARMR